MRVLGNDPNDRHDISRQDGCGCDDRHNAPELNMVLALWRPISAGTIPESPLNDIRAPLPFKVLRMPEYRAACRTPPSSATNECYANSFSGNTADPYLIRPE